MEEPSIWVKPIVNYTRVFDSTEIRVLDGSVGKESACNAENPGSVPGLGRSPGEWNGYPLQYSFLENSMDRGAWQAIAHGVSRRDGHNLVNEQQLKT